MRAKRSAALILIAAAMALTACDASAILGRRSQPSTRILFIGNSYTSINGGLDKQLEGLAPFVETARIDAGGYTLDKHWGEGKALQSIRSRRWDYVVLQEQSQTPIVNRASFYQTVTEFDVQIRSSSAHTVLLMTWERPDSVQFGVTTANLANAYQVLGTELGIKVAPAGSAFARSLRSRPALVLNSQDGHPTVYGTYLAACVLYGALFRSPVGNAYADGAITAEERTYLQRIAAEALGY